ncbi:MAG: insulinase family protein [Prevotellaceae bacterium]|jgi:zinc protease|nr:insulinase family protein [Prevotellaceae bacterium]
MVKRLLLILGLVFQSHLFASLEVHEHTLRNGLRIIVVPTNANGRVYWGILYKVGSVDDPECKIGVSHFLEHMMFYRTDNMSKESLCDRLGKCCISYGAYTNTDWTLYHHAVKKEFLHENMQIEADRMQNLKITDDDIEKERKVILEEKTRGVTPINSHMEGAVRHVMYLYSNYAYPTIGHKHHIERISRRSIIKHYKKYYVPNNATLIFVGDIQKNEAIELAEKYFGPIPSKELTRREIVDEPINTGITSVVEKSIPEIKIQTLEVTYTFDKSILATLKDCNVAALLTGILFSPTVVSKIMKDEKKLISGGNVSIVTYRGNIALCSVSMQLRGGISRHVVEEEFLKIVQDFCNKFLTEELLINEKEKKKNFWKFLMDSPEAIFYDIADAVKGGFTVCDMNNRAKIVASITLDDIKSTAFKIFKKENLTHKVYYTPVSCSEP